MSLIDVHIYVSSDKTFTEFAQSIADVLNQKLEARDGKGFPYMVSLHVGQGVYVECYMKEINRVYRTVAKNWGLFEYKISIRILWTDPIEGQATAIDVSLPISLSTTREDMIQAHIDAGKYIFEKLKESGQYRMILDRDYSNPLDVYIPDEN